MLQLGQNQPNIASSIPISLAWDLYKMATILQMTFSNSILEKKKKKNMNR